MFSQDYCTGDQIILCYLTRCKNSKEESNVPLQKWAKHFTYT